VRRPIARDERAAAPPAGPLRTSACRSESNHSCAEHASTDPAALQRIAVTCEGPAHAERCPREGVLASCTGLIQPSNDDHLGLSIFWYPTGTAAGDREAVQIGGLICDSQHPRGEFKTGG
jgi:hypothetical protein